MEIFGPGFKGAVDPRLRWSADTDEAEICFSTAELLHGSMLHHIEFAILHGNCFEHANNVSKFLQ